MNTIVAKRVLHYRDEGQGRVILMLHGWGTDCATFDVLSHELSKHYRVLRLDLPGFGGSEKPDDTWGVGEYTHNVNDFLVKVHIDEPYAIIAHSFGGRIAIKGIGTGDLTAKYLVLIAAAGVRHDSVSLKRTVYKLMAKVGKVVTLLLVARNFRDTLRHRLYQSVGSTDYLESGDMRSIFLHVINEDLRTFATNISIPTLMIWGENDTETPVMDANILHQHIKHSKLSIIPEAGHFVYTDSPQTVLTQIKSFLS